MERIERKSLVDVVDDTIIVTADKFCRAARKATKPGGSHELKGGTTAIPWVCTMLAAEQQGLSSQFDESIALSRSAIRPKDFQLVVQACRKLLVPQEAPEAQNPLNPFSAPNDASKIPLTADELVEEFEMPKSRIDDVTQLMDAFYAGAVPAKQQLYIDNTKGQYKNELIGALFWSMAAALNIDELPTRNQFASDWQLTGHTFRKYCEDADFYARDQLEALRKTGRTLEKTSPKREVGLEQSLATPTKRRRNAAEQAVIKTAKTAAAAQRPARTNDALKDLQSRRTTPQKPSVTSITSTPQKTVKRNTTPSNQTPRQAAARAQRHQRIETAKDNSSDKNSLSNSLLSQRWCFTDAFKSSYQPSRWEEFLQVRAKLIDELA
ncbi:hypothetical protein E3P86_01275 [Wallemia ichthyophaga]|uniref:Origin recognition complex subunit 6 n=1 Tax=Wallemia ichthyophaga TaxID=245174 RepID=A0A4T0J930_WALIC|nr:hypothetical protein E3P86_01275 [Wallemia ichthyophaga]